MIEIYDLSQLKILSDARHEALLLINDSKHICAQHAAKVY